jgi:hypothetical protein
MVVLLTVVLAACPGPAGMAERPDAARLQFLRRALGSAATTGARWNAVWGSTYAVTAVGQLAAVPWIVPSDQIEWYVGAATSAVGLAWVLRTTAEVGPAFAGREGDVCALIAEGEAQLARGAAHQAGVRAWYAHALNVALNVAIGLGLWLGWDKPLAGPNNFAIGAMLGEVTILTAPKRLVSAWAEYQRGDLPAEAAVSLSVGPGGLTLRF